MRQAADSTSRLFLKAKKKWAASDRRYVKKQKAKLKADSRWSAIRNCSRRISLAVRRPARVWLHEIEAGGRRRSDSGVYAAQRRSAVSLVEIISKLKIRREGADSGLYKMSKAPSKDELKAWKRLPFNEEKYRKAEVGAKGLTGEPGYSVRTGPGRSTLGTWDAGRFCGGGSEDGDSGEGVGEVSMRLVRTRTRRTS